MGRYDITISKLVFSSKSKALEYYKNILNSYESNSILDNNDFQNIMQLVEHRLFTRPLENFQIINDIKSIAVDYHPEFRRTKCFFLIGDDKKEIFSYRLAINGLPSDSQRFTNACRFLVADRLREFKKSIFKNRPVKCAITNNIVEWEECQIDHKSPLTFSVIVKSFIVANNIDISIVEYVSEYTIENFKDKDLANKFDSFHKDMAVLRILATKENNKLASSARIKPTKKDSQLI